MGTCFLYGNGGGSDLNFKVVGGTTKPSSPSANTIWVNTDTEITGWSLSSSDPSLRNLLSGIKLCDGYIKYDGGIHEITAANPEVNTDRSIKVSPDKTYTYSMSVSVTNTMWLAIAEYTGDNVFSTRLLPIPLITGTYYTGEYTPTPGVTSVRLSWRTFPGAKTTVTFTENASEGMVWIVTGSSSQVEFNTVKKNCVQVYPISAKQYISGSWVSKTATSYQSGSWVDWAVFLYNEGDECTDLTGGWSAYAYKQSGASSSVEETAPTVSRGSSSMTVRHNSSWEGYKHGVVLTNNSVDVTNFSTLSINVTAYTLSDANEGLRLILTKTKGNGFSIIASCSLNSTGVKTVNISSISGNYYVGIFGGGTNDPVSATFNKVYLS